MSTLYLNVGQAGGQIGALYARYTGPLSEEGHGCVFVDSEPKVRLSTSHSTAQATHNIIAHTDPASLLPPSQVVAPLVTDGSRDRIPFLPPSAATYDFSGRGNNWAWGYSNSSSRLGLPPSAGGAGGDKPAARGGVGAAVKGGGIARSDLLPRSLTAIRRHMERLGKCKTVVLSHSLGGGTGSGFGSRLLECVREEYPKLAIVDVVVAPFASGDTPLQHYNTVLALHTAQQHADAVMFFDNDDVLARTQQGKRMRSALSAGGTDMATARARAKAASTGARASGDEAGVVDTEELNVTIAECVTSVTMPTYHRKRWKGQRRAGGSASSGKPQWHDLRSELETEEQKRERAFANPFGRNSKEADAEDEDSDDDGGSAGTGGEGEEEEGRSSWITASVAAAAPAASRLVQAYGARGGRAASTAASAKFVSTFTGGGAGAGAGGGGDGGAGVIAASTLSDLLRADREAAAAAAAAGRAATAAAVGVPHAFDGGEFLSSLVHSPALKYLDCRTSTPLAGDKQLVTADSPAASWTALAENMVEFLPRYDSTGRLVRTHAARLIARGASQVDCDSVDPSLSGGAPPAASAAASAARGGRGGASSASRGGRGSSIASSSRRSPVGMAAVPTHWPGLPSTPDFDRVSLMLSRAANFRPEYSMDTVRSAVVSPFPVYASPLAPRKPVRSLTLVSNSDLLLPSLVRAVSRAEQLLAVNAYVQWYERYGVSADTIVEAMNSVLDTVDAYKG